MNAFLSGALGALGVLLTLAVVGAVLRRVAWRRRWRGGPFGLARALRQLGASPEQERTIRAEVDALVESLRALGADARALRGDLADLLAVPVVDAVRVGEVVDGRLARAVEARARFAQAFQRIHAALEPAQRERLAALVRFGRRGGCGGRPSRAHA